MIEKLVHGLAAGGKLTADEIMEVLWLSAIGRPPQTSATGAATGPADRPGGEADRQPTAEPPSGSSPETTAADPEAEIPLRLGGEHPGARQRIPATEVAFRSPRSIRDPLTLPRALRPLKRIRAPGPRPVIDINATVEATAEAGRLMVVSGYPPERALDLALVIDGTRSMGIWTETFDEFERLLLQTGAFRKVSRWRLVAAGDGVLIEDPQGIRHPARRLVDPSGRRLVFVATDATDRSWYASGPWEAVATWCAAMPTALIQVLPPHYWPGTAIGEPYVTARARRPASPNSQYTRRLAWWANDPGGQVVPVLTLTEQALDTWARAAVTGTAWVSGITATPPDPEYAPLTANDQADPGQLVNDFLALASPGAERLAQVLSAASTLSMPLISVLQKRLTSTGVTGLAEILASGLLVEIPSATSALLQFRPGVREILRRGTPASEEWDAYDAVSSYLSEHPQQVGRLRAFIPDPAGSASLDADLEPFAGLRDSLALRLRVRAPSGEPTQTPDEQVTVPPDETESAPAATDQPVLFIDAADRSGAVAALAMAPNGEWLASGGDDGTVRIWDLRTLRLRAELTGHYGGVCSLAVGPSGEWLASGGGDGTVRVWDVSTGHPRRIMSGHSGRVRALAMGPRGEWLASGGDDRTVRVWDLRTFERRAELSRHSGTVRALAVGHGGELLASGGDDGTVRVWDVGTGSPQRTIPGHSGGVRALAAAPNDAWLFAGDAAGTLRSWDSHNWGQRFVSNTGAGEVRALAMTPDGTRLACAGDGEMVRIYDAATGDMLAALAIPTGGVRALAVTPDGTRLACAGADGRIALRVLDVGERRTPAPASSEAESSVTQVPDGVVFTAEIAGRRITLNLPAEIAEANSGLPAEMEPPTSSDADALLDVQTEITLNTFEGGGQVVAVDGPPGSGKTQLAVHAARIARARGRFPGGVLFASLAGQGSIGDALTELLRALGLPAELIPGRTRDKEPLYRSVLAAYAQAGRRILVVIDDASVREQVIPMLPSDESTCVIVTSRSQLSIPDTTRLGLPPSGFQAGEPEFLPAPDLPPGPRNALVIATSHYVDPNLRQLRSPVHDADRFAAVLGDPAIGGFEVSQLHDRNSSAIRLEIARFLAGRAADETVLVYLSCHGTLDTRGRLMFAATDTDLQYPSATAIAASYLLERLDDCRARRQILILDCSFSGAFGGSEEGPARESSSSSTESGYGPAGESSGSGDAPAGESSGSGDAPRGERESGRKDAFDLGLQLGGYSHGREVLTASRSFEYTFEGEPLNDESTGSVFTTGLVEGLRTGAADAEGNGRITVQEAYDYAFRYVRQAGVPQTPQRWLSGAEGEPIVLARSVAGRSVIPAELPERMTTALESPYQDVRIGGINTIAEWLADPDPARRLAARRTLEEIAENDGPRVAAVASAHLNRI